MNNIKPGKHLPFKKSWLFGTEKPDGWRPLGRLPSRQEDDGSTSTQICTDCREVVHRLIVEETKEVLWYCKLCTTIFDTVWVEKKLEIKNQLNQH